MNKKISVVICTRNRAKLLKKCLNSLCRLTLPKNQYEIIVVNNGSTDDTVELVQSFQDKADIYLLEEKIPGLSRSRNLGWKYSKSPFIGFIDDDAWAETNWLENALECFEKIEPEISALTGEIELEWESAKPKWINTELKRSLSGLYLGDTPKFINNQHYIVGTNCFFSRKILNELNGFSETLGRTGKTLLSGEEIELQKRMELSGKQVYYHPKVKVHHFVPSDRLKPEWFYKRYYWGGVSDAREKKNTDIYNRSNRSWIIGSTGNSISSRVVKNIFCLINPKASYKNKVHSRIYFYYAIGYLVGKIKRYSQIYS